MVVAKVSPGAYLGGVPGDKERSSGLRLYQAQEAGEGRGGQLSIFSPTTLGSRWLQHVHPIEREGPQSP